MLQTTRLTAGHPRPDLPTLAAVGILAYVVSALLHEGAGHGLACWLLGGTPRRLTSIALYSDPLTPLWRERVVLAAGSTANLATALGAFLALRRRRSPWGRCFCWLLLTLGLLEPGGYLPMCWFFGDWHGLTAGLRPLAAWRAGLTLGGIALYLLGIRLAVREVQPFLPAVGPERDAIARRMAHAPYIAGSSVGCLTALLDPGGPGMALIAIGAYFGATSALTYLDRLAVRATPAPAGEPHPVVSFHPGWLGAGVAAAALFILVLGRGIPLATR